MKFNFNKRVPMPTRTEGRATLARSPEGEVQICRETERVHVRWGNFTFALGRKGFRSFVRLMWAADLMLGSKRVVGDGLQALLGRGRTYGN